MAVGVRKAVSRDWVALTIGITGAGVAIIALILMLDREPQHLPDCGATDAACVE
tara:strand:- start:387 stop:548 length:162 start_codon:yes stop_codon:yes gene_type:complete